MFRLTLSVVAFLIAAACIFLLGFLVAGGSPSAELELRGLSALMDAGHGVSDFWKTVNEPQAIIFSAIFTVAAAAIGVVLGSALFGDRVNGMKAAIDKSLAIFEEVRADIASTAQGLGELRGTVGDIQQASEAGEATDGDGGNVAGGAPPAPTPLEQFGVQWRRIRTKLEGVASDPTLPQRARSRYAGVDRRNYRKLVTEIAADGRLPADDLNGYINAIRSWRRFNGSKTPPSSSDIADMKAFADRVAPDVPEEAE